MRTSIVRCGKCNGGRIVMRFASRLISAVLIFSMTFPAGRVARAADLPRMPRSSKEYREMYPSSNEVVTQNIRNFADEFAEIYLKKELVLESTSGLINEVVTSQLELYRSHLSNKSRGFWDLRSNVFEHQLRDSESFRLKRGLLQVALFYGLLFGTIGASLAITGDDEGSRLAKALIFGHLIVTLASKSGTPFHAISKLILQWQVDKSATKGFQKVFFGRLAELGIYVPPSKRDTWFFSQMDGNPVADWSSLSSSEKVKWANEYADHLQQMASTQVGNEEARKKLNDLSEQVRNKIPSWVSRWRSKSFRELSRAIGETFHKITQLQEEFPILRSPEELPTLFANRRAIYDHRHLLTERAYQLFLESKIGMPSDLESSLPRIAELGGKIDVAWTYAGKDAAPGKALYQFNLNLTFPDSEPLSYERKVILQSRATDQRYVHLSEFPRGSMEIYSGLQDALVSDGFALALKRKWEAKNPEKACSQALTSVENAFEAIP